ncbi:hypothetical protein ACQKK2_13090 [Bacillus paranthracis]|uniref:hypothetical protein n=1 Tax=Bacillus paranthracis TaxID=2026186 RepID=UPI001124D43F|nr:hypothetical protein [Bacillus paranthracis]MDA1695327.1 hypothetical protein [Bacillus cereus group sp. m1-2]MDK7532757.1 hypothetical protein [Bacillus paranthracis]USL20449.1 hypothetical protein LIS80_06645 [Bacillus paranthracis]
MAEIEALINEMKEVYEIKEESLTFYKSRINKFFLDYMGLQGNKDKPLNAITYFDVDMFLKSLKCSDAEKVNYYSALKRLFEYTYLKGKTNEIISQVTKPVYERKQKEILKEDEYVKLKNFIVDRDKVLNERLILGLFLFTGLSRQYMASLRNNQFEYEKGVYKLVIWKDESEVKLPLKSELQLLIHEYCTATNNKLDKVVQMPENTISTYIGTLTESIVGRRCTPTILSNTFISKALSDGNFIWEVSKLTLESVTTIEKHIINTNNLMNRQTSILNSF